MNRFKRKKEKTVHFYECTMTGKRFKRTAVAKNPSELVSVEAYYQLNVAKDDRPLVVKKKLGVETV